jgi:hypothetical protein
MVLINVTSVNVVNGCGFGSGPPLNRLHRYHAEGLSCSLWIGKNPKVETRNQKRQRAAALATGAAAVCTAPFDFTAFVLPVRSAGDVGNKPRVHVCCCLVAGLERDHRNNWNFGTLGTDVSLIRLERSEAVERFERFELTSI